jgi:G:T-mismatch repair DNA endonuclease (very short patch repair protein)
LSKHGIQHKVQEQVGKYYFDIKIGNILIEVNGDYWHANPKFYRGNQIIKYPGRRKKLVANIWKKDLKKMLQARKKGYRVIYLWENDINNWTEGQLI